jgi:hypothetical protein
MGDGPRIECAPTLAVDSRRGRRFPISPAGWVGIAAAVVGVAYFLIPEGTQEQAPERKPPPEARSAAPQPTGNRYEVVGPAVRDKSADERDAAAKKEKAPR